jgi:hypothetical protein
MPHKLRSRIAQTHCATSPADAPVTPTTGPAIGFWLRPFNYFDESAAAAQPGMVYMPALTQQQAEAAAAAAAAGNETFTLAAAANSSAGNATRGSAAAGAGGPSGLGGSQAGLGRDDMIELITITSAATLTAARRGIQPYVGLPLRLQCLPRLPSVPFNGSYAPFFSATLAVPPGTVPTAAAGAGGGGNGSAAAGNGSVVNNGSTPSGSGGSATYG